MRYYKHLLFLAAAAALAAGCHTRKNPTQSEDISEYTFPDDYTETEALTYKPAKTRINNLVHTRLEVRFDYKNQYLNGKAYITLTPHFYDTDSLTLDAKGMEIKSVKLTNTVPGYGQILNAIADLKYTYNKKQMRITLDKTYKKGENYTVYVEYVAKPNELQSTGSAAIHDAKGLYFIDPLDTIPDKPTQIWTQGETEAASCWFPTIDATNQKCTEEIYITVPKQYITLSNGELVYGKENNDGTRTDYWKQEKPHAPYLFMMAVGEFAEIKDKWRGKDVNYYVEKAYEPYARMVFGHTPEMMEFYSNTLGVEYPWAKFHQVVVRDFVSGAMENTSCVVHYDKLQHDSREHLDETCETIVAHELFHHWFGDLVTCESWANLPLNESFANYGEYLWTEHKYGRTEADINIKEYLDQYMGEAEGGEKNLVRYYHDKPDDMFDAHSYQKGGCVLHMLRKYTGDRAFYAALNLYLTRHSYKSAEIHDLRLAFEEVTGEDLNWFFDQWFLGSGHPELQVMHSYNAADRQYIIKVSQTRTGLGNTFRLPVDIDIHYKNSTERKRIWIDKDSQTFAFSVKEKPTWVNFDAENQILGRIQEEKPFGDWQTQLKEASLEYDKQQALRHIVNDFADRQLAIELVKTALSDSSWRMREQALYCMQELGLEASEYAAMSSILVKTATKDPKSDVRTATIVPLFTSGTEEGTEAIKNMLNDSSYKVCGNALYALSYIDPVTANMFAEQNRYTRTESLKVPVGYALAITSTKDELPYFKSMILQNTGGNRYEYINIVGVYLRKADAGMVDEGIIMLQKMCGDILLDDLSGRYMVKNALQELVQNYDDMILQLKVEQTTYKKKSEAYNSVESRIAPLQIMRDKVQKAAEGIVL